MENRAKILVVEDDCNINNFISTILTTSGYIADNAPNGKKAMSCVVDGNYDVILLDLGLPDIDGMKILKSLRAWLDTPIIVVSARGEELEKVEALDAGADDYITKPFGNHELLARIRTTIRLHQRLNKRTERSDDMYYSVGDLIIDYDKRLVTKRGQQIRLTPTEYNIVVLLSRNAGRVLTHDSIISSIWGPYKSDDQTLRVNMANIRRKIEDNPADPRYILTEVRVGYKIADD